MHHLGGNIQRRFAGNELDSAPATGTHALGIMAGQSHATHDIDLEIGFPQGIFNIKKLPCAVNAQAIHQNIGLRLRRNQRGNTFRGSKITGDTTGIVPARHGMHFGHRRIYPLLITAHHGDLRTGCGQTRGNGQSDTTGRTGHNGCFS